MGNLEDTQAAYLDKEEKVMPERDKMGLVQALQILHTFRDISVQYDSDSQISAALDAIFEWIDNAVLLFHKLGGTF